METIDELRTTLTRRPPATTAEEIRERLAGQEAEARPRKIIVYRPAGTKKAVQKRRPPRSPVPPLCVRLTRPCLSRIFKTYLPTGSKGKVIGRVSGKLNILFGRTLVAIAEDSSLIEAVK